MKLERLVFEELSLTFPPALGPTRELTGKHFLWKSKLEAYLHKANPNKMAVRVTFTLTAIQSEGGKNLKVGTGKLVAIVKSATTLTPSKMPPLVKKAGAIALSDALKRLQPVLSRSRLRISGTGKIKSLKPGQEFK